MSGSAGQELMKIERIEFAGWTLEAMLDLQGSAWMPLRATRSAQKKPEFSAKRVGKGRLGTQWSPRAWLLPAHKPEAARGTPGASL